MSSSCHVVDMRSDTVTKPTAEMRRAMAEAEVGDDVLGEDPTINLLQEKAARLLGKEAALFVPSGTMANLISVLTHCSRRGEEAIIGDRSHIAMWEQGGVSQLGGVFVRTVKNLPDGSLDLDELCSKILTDSHRGHCSITRLICVENTHNFMGGRALSPQYMDKLAAIAQKFGIRIHVDGARLFNAAMALGVPATELVKHADSVNICLSKGLGAPVGSLVVGSREFIATAHKMRKVVGGGMRQAGILAAAGIISLDEIRLRLQQDHDNAKRLAEGLAEMADLGVKIDPSAVQTNIVIFHLQRADLAPEEFCARLNSPSNGNVVVKVSPVIGPIVRAVIHHQVSREDVELSLVRIKDVLRSV